MSLYTNKAFIYPVKDKSFSHSRSYTVKPTLKSWKDKEPEESRQYHEPGIAGNEGNETEEPSTSGSVRNSNTNPIVGSADEELSRENEVGDSRPIPPRRIGSNQWRRNSSQARAQQNSTNVNLILHFFLISTVLNLWDFLLLLG